MAHKLDTGMVFLHMVLPGMVLLQMVHPGMVFLQMKLPGMVFLQMVLPVTDGPPNYGPLSSGPWVKAILSKLHKTQPSEK